MGRAKGPKRLASPAPGRGTYPPELLDWQSRGGMAPDFHEMWHERGGGMEVSTNFSGVDTDDVRSLYLKPWPRYATRQLLMRLGNTDNLAEDEIIQAVFENESMRISQWADRYETATGQTSILRSLSKETMLPLWNDRFVGFLEKPGDYIPSWSFINTYFFSPLHPNPQHLGALLEEWETWNRVDPEGFRDFIRDEGPRSFNEMTIVAGEDFFSEELFASISNALIEDYEGPSPQSFYESCQSDDVMHYTNPSDPYRSLFAGFRIALTEKEENSVSDVDAIYAEAFSSMLRGQVGVADMQHPIWKEWEEHLQNQGVPAGLCRDEILQKLQDISPDQARSFAAGEISAEDIIRALF